MFGSYTEISCLYDNLGLRNDFLNLNKSSGGVHPECSSAMVSQLMVGQLMVDQLKWCLSYSPYNSKSFVDQLFFFSYFIWVTMNHEKNIFFSLPRIYLMLLFLMS